MHRQKAEFFLIWMTFVSYLSVLHNNTTYILCSLIHQLYVYRHCKTDRFSDIFWKKKMSRTSKTHAYNHVQYQQNQAKILPRSGKNQKVFAVSACVYFTASLYIKALRFAIQSLIGNSGCMCRLSGRTFNHSVDVFKSRNRGLHAPAHWRTLHKTSCSKW